MRLFRLQDTTLDPINRQFDRVASALTDLEVTTKALASKLHALSSITQVTSGGSSGGTVADIDSAIRARVLALTTMREFSYWSDPMLTKAGRPGSLWQDLAPTDSHSVADFPGGVISYFANTGFGGAVVDAEGSYPFAPTFKSAFFSDMSNSEWYIGTRFMLQPDPGSGTGGWTNGQNAFLIGVVDATTLKVAGVGIALNKGAFFGAVTGNVNGTGNTIGQDSNTPKDFSVFHYGELYRTGGKVWVNIDNGTPVDVSATLTGPALPATGTPLIELLSTGVRQPSICVDHVAFAAPRNGAVI